MFWDDVKVSVLASINDAFIKEDLSTSQKKKKKKKWVVKLTEKKIETKDLLRTEYQYPYQI